MKVIGLILALFATYCCAGPLSEGKTINTFLHIPKTGGKAVAFVLTEFCANRFNHTTVTAPSWHAFDGTQFFLNAIDAGSKNDQVLLLPRHTLMQFGYLEQSIVSRSPKNTQPQFHYFFFLREPKERVLSAYFDLYKKKCLHKIEDTNAEEVAPMPPSFEGCQTLKPLREWLNSSTFAWGRGNEMTFRLSASISYPISQEQRLIDYDQQLRENNLDLPFAAEVDVKQAYQDALDVIHRKKKDASGEPYKIWFGITERWRESVHMLLDEHFPGCTLPERFGTNMQKDVMHRPHFPDLPADLAAIVSASTQWDTLLYNAAAKEFKDVRLKAERNRALTVWKEEFMEKQLALVDASERAVTSKGRYAWVLLFIGSSRQQLESAVTLIYSLKRSHTKADIVVITRPTMPQDDTSIESPADLFVRLGCKPLEIAFPRRMSVQDKIILSKVSSLLFTVYEKVIFLDSDQMVLQNMDGLFSNKGLALKVMKKSNKVDGGLMLFEGGNEEDYDALVELLKTGHQGVKQIWTTEFKEATKLRMRYYSAQGLAYYYYSFVKETPPKQLMQLHDLWHYGASRSEPWAQQPAVLSKLPPWKVKRMHLWWDLNTQANRALGRKSSFTLPAWARPPLTVLSRA